MNTNQPINNPPVNQFTKKLQCHPIFLMVMQPLPIDDDVEQETETPSQSNQSNKLQNQSVKLQRVNTHKFSGTSQNQDTSMKSIQLQKSILKLTTLNDAQSRTRVISLAQSSQRDSKQLSVHFSSTKQLLSEQSRIFKNGTQLDKNNKIDENRRYYAESESDSDEEKSSDEEFQKNNKIFNQHKLKQQDEVFNSKQLINCINQQKISKQENQRAKVQRSSAKETSIKLYNPDNKD